MFALRPLRRDQAIVAVGQRIDFVDIISEKLNAQMAFLQGRLKVAGDMSLALKLGTILKG